ncbi:MAG: hypothetical protein E7206_04780 [Clostridium beijerinckii]|nr:hypothetical protein [Clostridium beijerinckii]
MATSKKIITSNNKTDIVTTTYQTSFLSNINRKGRRKHDYNLLGHNQFTKCLNQKVLALKKYNKQLDYIAENNTFNYFVTINGITKKTLKKIINRVHMADKQLTFVTLASWTANADLHYHILFYSSLDKSQLENKLNEGDALVKEIYDLEGLIRYFKRNINYDTCYILRQIDNKDLHPKQIEILQYSKILSTSKNLALPKIIKNPSQQQLENIYSNNTFIESIKYKKLDSSIIIDKFKNK